MDMNFYNKNNNLSIYHRDNIIGIGSSGVVYKLDDDTCIKVFYEDGYYNEEEIEAIMNMNLDNYYEIYKLLYNSEKKDTSYTMKYYLDEDIDILKLPILYTLDNLNGIYKSIVKLSKEMFLVCDLYYGNVITNKDEIIVIDVDRYKHIKSKKVTKKELLNRNTKALYRVFRQLYCNSICRRYDDLKKDEKIIYEIYDLFDIENKPIDIYKKLVKYKYPIDYIRDKKK